MNDSVEFEWEFPDGRKVTVTCDEWQPEDRSVGIMRGYFAWVGAVDENGKEVALSEKEEDELIEHGSQMYEDSMYDEDWFLP